MSNFSTNLKTLMKKYKVQQRTLAEETGMDESTISNYLAQRRSPQSKQLIAIAQYFKVDCIKLAQGEIK